MSPSRLRIDTSVARIQAQTPTYVLSRDTVISAPTHRQSSRPRTRVRSASSASASSSTSDPSRALNKVAVSLDQYPHSAYPSTADPHVPDHSNWSPTYSSSGESDPGSPGYVLAMHDFAPQHQNVTCLGFKAGEVIHVLNRDASGWWDGEVDGRRGWFPSNYVTSEVGLLTNEELPKPVSTFSRSLFLPTSFAQHLFCRPTRDKYSLSTLWENIKRECWLLAKKGNDPFAYHPTGHYGACMRLQACKDASSSFL